MAFVKPSLVSKPSRNVGCFLRLRSAILHNKSKLSLVSLLTTGIMLM